MFLINGQPRDAISVLDRGFQYGDGLFETLAVEHGTPLCLDEHLARLGRGCRRLYIPEPEPAVLEREIEAVAGALDRGVLKIIITRGPGGRGYGPAGAGPATRVVAGFEWPNYPPEYQERGIKTGLCATRLARNPALAGIKHLNRLEQILGRAECESRGLPEGIMMDTGGNLVEGTMSNLFLVRGGELMTPLLTQSGVEGIVRHWVLRLARTMPGLGVRETALAPIALRGAEEVFFSNSVMGIWPVKRCGEYTYAVGPVTRRLRGELVGRGIILA